MKPWIQSLRPAVSILAGLLTLASFKVAGLSSPSWLIPGAVIAIFSAIMVHNDWRDRLQDVKKGKTLAATQLKKFLSLLISLWIVAVILTAIVWQQNIRFGILLALMILAGVIYSETRQIPMVPAILVAIASASPALFPVFIIDNSVRLWLFFSAVALVIFSREIIKDLIDLGVESVV